MKVARPKRPRGKGCYNGAMDLPTLIAALSRPSAYPHAPAEVVALQTHISAVFLAGPLVYKVKKPVRFDFLDFSTLEKRRFFCGEEVRLNRRLAPDVYLDVVPIVATPDGVRVEAVGEPVEWAVKMRRLPREATLHAMLEAGDVSAALVEAFARRLADFHRAAPAPADKAHYGRAAVVAGNIRELFDESAGRVGVAVSRAVFDRLRTLFDAALARHGPLLDARADRGRTRDAHGDLHLDHVYAFPDRPFPNDLAIIDGIEFNERFRFIDPVADVAFAVMDFAYHGRRDLARTCADAYFAASGDAEGRALLPLLSAYRAAVRGAVDGMKLAEAEVPEVEKAEALASSRGHWLLALAELEEPKTRPCLLLVGGLQGTGKSTLARALAARHGFVSVRSDAVRKRLAGVAEAERLSEEFYTPEWNEKTYRACLDAARAEIGEGRRVVVDATFRAEKERRRFLDAARAWGVPALGLMCRASAETVRTRLGQRRGDVSDADGAVYEATTRQWEEPTASRSLLRDVTTDGTPDEAVAQATAILRADGLE